MAKIAILLVVGVAVIVNCFTIIEVSDSESSADNLFVDENAIDFETGDLLLQGGESDHILETIYASQPVGKSHRFYYTAGKREASKELFFFLIHIQVNTKYK